MEDELQNLINELIKLGEDKEELATIADLFPALDNEGKLALIESLKKERDALK